MLLRNTLGLALAFLALVGTGCDSNSAKETARVSLSMSALQNPAAKAGDGAAVITITSAKFLIKSIRLHSATGNDSLDFRSSSAVAFLALDGAYTELGVSNVELGRYDQVSFLVHKVGGNETPSDPDFASGGERYSTVIAGLYDGTPFVYRSAKTFHQLVAFPAALAVDGVASTLNVTLQMDIGSWFVNNQGAQLDPRDQSNGNMAQIDQSIHDSFRVFRDSNRDGRPD